MPRTTEHVPFNVLLNLHFFISSAYSNIIYYLIFAQFVLDNAGHGRWLVNVISEGTWHHRAGFTGKMGLIIVHRFVIKMVGGQVEGMGKYGIQKSNSGRFRNIEKM